MLVAIELDIFPRQQSSHAAIWWLCFKLQCEWIRSWTPIYPGGCLDWQPPSVYQGFPRRLESLKNENGHGKVMEHETLVKNHGILLFSHGILPILPPICTKFVFLWSPLRN